MADHAPRQAERKLATAASRSDAGFTAVELGVTLALIGLVLAFNVARIDSSSWRLDTAIQEVNQRLRAARTLAVLKQHDVVVRFEVATGSIVIHEDANGDGSVDDDERAIRHTLDGNVRFDRGDAPPYAGFTGGAVSFEAGTVTFLRNGSASQEGAVYVGWPGAEKGRVVVLHRATGYTEVHRYDGSKWSTS
ncbi:MAG: GspH/FimT family protein [Gemmatimonadales bacterium]|jgi:Tfp pilus assembly protein FimT